MGSGHRTQLRDCSRSVLRAPVPEECRESGTVSAHRAGERGK